MLSSVLDHEKAADSRVPRCSTPVTPVPAGLPHLTATTSSSAWYCICEVSGFELDSGDVNNDDKRPAGCWKLPIADATARGGGVPRYVPGLVREARSAASQARATRPTRPRPRLGSSPLGSARDGRVVTVVRTPRQRRHRPLTKQDVMTAAQVAELALAQAVHGHGVREARRASVLRAWTKQTVPSLRRGGGAHGEAHGQDC